MVPADSARETSLRTLRFIQRRADEVFVFDAADHSGDLHPALAPIALFTSLEFFYYYLSIAKDHNPDDRRYYGGKAEDLIDHQHPVDVPGAALSPPPSTSPEGQR